MTLPGRPEGDIRASQWKRGMWHQGQEGLPSPWVLVSASLSLCVLTCKMGMRIKEGLGTVLASLGLHEEKLIFISLVGGSGMLLIPSEALQAPCTQQELGECR